MLMLPWTPPWCFLRAGVEPGQFAYHLCLSCSRQPSAWGSVHLNGDRSIFKNNLNFLLILVIFFFKSWRLQISSSPPPQPPAGSDIVYINSYVLHCHFWFRIAIHFSFFRSSVFAKFLLSFNMKLPFCPLQRLASLCRMAIWCKFWYMAIFDSCISLTSVCLSILFSVR